MPHDLSRVWLQTVKLFLREPLAHEYCHFIADERLREKQGVELESFCDALALQISRNRANPVDSWLAFTGIGPLVLFRSLQLCEGAREQLIAARPGLFRSSIFRPDEHAPLEDRILAIRELLLRNTAADQRDGVEQFLEEYDRIAQAVIHLVSGSSNRPLKPRIRLRSPNRAHCGNSGRCIRRESVGAVKRQQIVPEKRRSTHPI